MRNIVLIELNVPRLTNIPTYHAIKTKKKNYKLKKNYIVYLYGVEVEARGIGAKFLYNLQKDLGLSKNAVSCILKQASKATLVGSYVICLGRERNTSRESSR